jgi:hypothetical protein
MAPAAPISTGSGTIRIENMCLHVTNTDGVSVGYRMGDSTDADAAARTANILNDDCLAQRRFHALRQYARYRVRRPASGIRHYHHYGS